MNGKRDFFVVLRRYDESTVAGELTRHDHAEVLEIATDRFADNFSGETWPTQRPAE